METIQIKKLVTVTLLSLWVLSTVLPLAVGEDPSLDVPKEGNISFQPNVIPYTTVYREVNKTSNLEGSGERFRFEWNNPLDTDEPNRFDIELFFNATIYKKEKGVWQNVTKMWSLHDFEDDFDVSVDYQAVKSESSVQFGWVLENPDGTNEWVHNAWFKIEDTQPFDYDDIWIIEGLGENETSDFYLPDNLVLSFKDLEHKGFVIGSQNKTSMSVKGFSEESSWDLDPITYSDPTITVTDTLSSDANWYVWNASNVNGWGAVFNYDNMTYFYNSSKLKIASGGTFTDKNVQMVFNTTSEIAIFNDSSNFQLGTLEDSVNKVTSGGCSVLFDLAGGANDVAFYADASSTTKLYGCMIESQSHHSDWYVYHTSATAHYYETTFSGIRIRGSVASIASFDLKRVTQTGTLSIGGGLYSLAGTFDDISVERNLYAIQQSFGTITNLKARNNTKIAYMYSYTSDSYLINPDVDVWDWIFHANYNNEVFRQYTFDLTVTTASNVPIEDANVTLTYYGQGGGTHGTWLTDANGEIPEQTVTAGFYNQTGGNTIYSYNPYEITITKADYLTYQRNFTQLEAKSWNIALLEDTGKSASWYLSGTIIIGFPLFLGLLLLFIVVVKKRH